MANLIVPIFPVTLKTMPWNISAQKSITPMSSSLRPHCSSLDEDYYQAMAKVIEKRFTNWQGQEFDEDTLEPSEVAEALMEYLDCECTYFPP